MPLSTGFMINRMCLKYSFKTRLVFVLGRTMLLQLYFTIIYVYSQLKYSFKTRVYLFCLITRLVYEYSPLHNRFQWVSNKEILAHFMNETCPKYLKAVFIKIYHLISVFFPSLLLVQIKHQLVIE